VNVPASTTAKPVTTRTVIAKNGKAHVIPASIEGLPDVIVKFCDANTGLDLGSLGMTTHTSADTGSIGLFASGKVTLHKVEYQVTCHATVCHSGKPKA
jgi:hypothetical protein